MRGILFESLQNFKRLPVPFNEQEHLQLDWLKQVLAEQKVIYRFGGSLDLNVQRLFVEIG